VDPLRTADRYSTKLMDRLYVKVNFANFSAAVFDQATPPRAVTLQAEVRRWRY